MPTRQVVSIAESVLLATRHLVPFQLRLRRRAALALVLLAAVAGLGAWLSVRDVMQTVGRDAAPSIIAAQDIRTALADAHTQIVNVLLAGESDSGPSALAFRQSIAKANDHLVSAAQNITYGEEERLPILATMGHLAEYQRLIGRTLAQRGDPAALLQADALMRERILPQARQLDQTNEKHLNQAYADERRLARGWTYLFVATTGLLALLLLETQLFLARRFRRRLSPVLLAGLLAMLTAAGGFLSCGAEIGHQMKVAKEDAFDSVYLLAQSKAWAYLANAQQSIYLLLPPGRDKVAQQALFAASAARLFHGEPPTDARAFDAKPDHFRDKGLLGEEMASIDFDGEASSAAAALRAWGEYLRIAARARGLEDAGRHSQALALSLGGQPRRADWAFDNFIESLDHTRAINQQAFDGALGGARQVLERMWKWLAAALLAPLLAMAFGLRSGDGPPSA
ncbi:hypothetical protein ACPRNU_22430 [Chromobacterium vaccinii]|uniref:hypothetical protein n=1 Tax=Chromobacterium vaccinii TaxID=1108595 RepID=UPI003C75C5EB